MSMSAPQRFLLLRGFVVPGVRLQNGGDRQRFIVLQGVLHEYQSEIMSHRAMREPALSMIWHAVIRNNVRIRMS